MQLGLGLGLGSTVYGFVPPPVVNNFTGALPAGWTYTRNDAVTTLRDSSGNLQMAAANTLRIDHDIAGNLLGTMTEPGVTNRLTDRNANPTATTGWTAGGDAGAVFSVVSDPSSYLSASTCKLQAVCSTGKLYKLDNTAGTTDAYVTSAGTISVTTKSMLSVWSVASTGTGVLTRTGTGTPETLTLPNDTKLVRRALIVTPSATTDTMKIVAHAGAVVYFILAQMEAGISLVDAVGNPVPTSEIVTTGATATRAKEIPSVPFTSATGAIVATMIVAGYDQVNAQMAFAAVGNSNADYSGPLMGKVNGASNGFFQSYSVHNFTNGTNGATNWNCPPTMKRYPIGFAFKPGETTMCAGPMRPQVTAITNQPVAPDHIYLGSRGSSAGDAMKAWYQQVVIFSYYATPEQMGAYMFNAGDNAIAVSGQSLGQYYSLDQAPNPYRNDGEVAFVASMDGYWTTSRNWLVQGATGGTGLLKVSDPVGYWYDPDTATFGPSYYAWEKAAKTFLAGGGVIRALFHSGHETDTLNVATTGFGAGNNGAQFQASLVIVFQKMLTIVGNVPVFIDPIGRRQISFVTNNGYEIMRELQYALPGLYSWINMLPEKFDQPLDPTSGNNVHMAPAGFATQAPRIDRKIRQVLNGDVVGAVDGPTIRAATRSGTTVTITASEAMSPASSAQGLTFFDGTTQILFTSVTVSGTTITGTLASSPSGTHTETLYMGYNDMPDITDSTKILVSAASSLPLCGGKPLVLPYTA